MVVCSASPRGSALPRTAAARGLHPGTGAQALAVTSHVAPLSQWPQQSPATKSAGAPGLGALPTGSLLLPRPALIPLQQTFNQGIKTNCLEIKPLMLSNQHTSCLQQQRCSSIFHVNGSLFGAGPCVWMLRHCDQPEWEAAGQTPAKLREYFLT